MKLRRHNKRTPPEPTIALINVVFLMLIFFMVAGALAPPMDDRVALANTAEIDGRSPPDAVVILADGEMTWRGEPIGIDAAAAKAEEGADGPELRLVPDRALPAPMLMETVAALSQAGVAQVWLVTERGLAQ